jgi:hypothetical protein
VVDLGIVEVDRLFQQPEPQGAQKEIEVSLGVANRGGDVVQAENGMLDRISFVTKVSSASYCTATSMKR